MNTTICNPCVITDATLDILDRYCATDLQEDFATRPLQAVQAVPQRDMTLDEESLHMSFEEAISDRISALGMNWDLTKDDFAITGKGRALKRAVSNPITSAVEVRENGRIALLENSWQRHITYICLALMFMLMGFDFMGLLILHTH